MSVSELDSNASEAALARKRRIAMRNRQRSPSSSADQAKAASEGRNKRSRDTLAGDDEEHEPATVPSSTSVADLSSVDEMTVEPKRKKPHITGIKKQSRYDPGVSMTKEELKAWRKEARRVRNRESAAASRRKNREAITNLETEVEDMKTRYAAALRYILHLEDERQQTGAGSSTSATASVRSSAVLRQDLQQMKKSPEPLHDNNTAYSRCCSADGEAAAPAQHTVSPPLTPSEDRPPQEEEEVLAQPRMEWPVQTGNVRDKNKSIPHRPDCDRHHRRPTFDSHQHIIDTTISRPIAAKIPPGAKENTSNDDNEREKDDATLVSDTAVSDDDDNDSAMITSTGTSSASSSAANKAVKARNDYYYYSYYGSDDESTIESDQPLFLDTIPVSSNSSTLGAHTGTHTGSDADANEDNTIIAEFLKGVFVGETDAANPRIQSAVGAVAPAPSMALPDIDLGFTAADMEALLLDGDSNAMVLPDPCVEN